MANICTNHIAFHGPEEALKNLKKAFLKTIEARKTNPNVAFILFSSKVPIIKYFIDLYINDDYSVSFETKWAPDPVQAIRIAQMFGVSFIYSYEELGSDDYGEFYYNHTTKELKDRCLTLLHFDKCKICDNDNHPDDCDPTKCKDYAHDFEKMDEILKTIEFNDCTYSLDHGRYTIQD